jgi:phenylalanyl-tRNA synthetase beta chain
MKVPFTWLKEYVDVRLKPSKVAERLTMSGTEVEATEELGRDVVFELGVTPNRSDCLSVLGVAREIAAITGSRFHALKVKPPKGEGVTAQQLKVSIHARKRCPRYAARIIDGVRIGPSPAWMAARLAACGVRSINNVVDATNYVMLETGQPLHAFDRSLVHGGSIVVRTAREGEAFTTLDGVERKLTEEDLLICDARGPVALAGVMGGENSEVRDTTTSLILESAHFESSGVRRTSKRLGLISESSRRFERGVDPNGVIDALNRLTELILQVAGGTATADWIDVYPAEIKPVVIPLQVKDVDRMLGVKLTSAKAAKYLKALGMWVTRSKGGVLSVRVPTFRPDLARPIDLVEEIARVHGYEKIEESMPTIRMAPVVRPRMAAQEVLARAALIDCGLSECVLYGFTSPESLSSFEELGPSPVKIANPLSNDQAVMCTTLLPGLMDALRLNINRQRADLRLFALQRIFHRPGAVGPSDEPMSLAGVLTGRRWAASWERSREMLDFYDAKGAVENVLEALSLSEVAIYQRGQAPAFLHPGKFAYVLCEGQRVGFVGEVHPDVSAQWDCGQEVYVFELHFEVLAELQQTREFRYKEYSKFPFVTRDISIVLKENIPLVEGDLRYRERAAR